MQFAMTSRAKHCKKNIAFSPAVLPRGRCAVVVAVVDVGVGLPAAEVDSDRPPLALRQLGRPDLGKLLFHL